MAPTLVAATSPFLNSIKVGIPRTPYLVGVIGLSSMLTLATITWSPFSAASSSRNGAIILHGPHHSAQKSTTTGTGDLSTSASNESSLVVMTVMLVTPRRWIRPSAARVRVGRRERQGEVVMHGSEIKARSQPVRTGRAAPRRGT